MSYDYLIKPAMLIALYGLAWAVVEFALHGLVKKKSMSPAVRRKCSWIFRMGMFWVLIVCFVMAAILSLNAN